uniref:Caspase 9, apoptosis-related cysteine peptidase n=1 Tax=Neogobius melanostomus TaxID=47308 RepID=A0A8C6SJK4_9GOBI
MEERHKKILQRNRTNLVKELDPSRLYDLLLEKRIFTQDMIDEIKSAGTRRDQARELVRDIATRGSRAFPLFVEILRETGHLSLVEALQEGAPLGPLQPSDPPVPRPVVQPLPIGQFMPFSSCFTTGLRLISLPRPAPDGDFLKPRPQRVRRDSIQSYKMDAAPCGHCLIINNVEFDPRSELNNRSGSDVDRERLERRFKELNFIVEVKTNLKQRQIKHELSALSNKDHSPFDCCVVIILSHGTEVSHNRFPGAVYGVDGLFVPVQHITNYLNGQRCPSLQGKPKLFFIQACGGDEKDTGFEFSPEDELAPSCGGEDDQTDAIPMSSSSDSLSMSDEPDARATLPTPSDILVSYSTFPGYVSWRDPRLGSWYVETLDHVLAENAATDDLVTMLMMVNHEVSQNSAKGLYKQMPGSFNFLRKLLYFQAQN